MYDFKYHVPFRKIEEKCIFEHLRVVLTNSHLAIGNGSPTAKPRVNGLNGWVRFGLVQVFVNGLVWEGSMVQFGSVSLNTLKVRVDT